MNTSTVRPTGGGSGSRSFRRHTRNTNRHMFRYAYDSARSSRIDGTMARGSGLIVCVHRQQIQYVAYNSAMTAITRMMFSCHSGIVGVTVLRSGSADGAGEFGEWATCCMMGRVVRVPCRGKRL